MKNYFASADWMTQKDINFRRGRQYIFVKGVTKLNVITVEKIKSS